MLCASAECSDFEFISLFKYHNPHRFCGLGLNTCC